MNSLMLYYCPYVQCSCWAALVNPGRHVIWPNTWLADLRHCSLHCRWQTEQAAGAIRRAWHVLRPIWGEQWALHFCALCLVYKCDSRRRFGEHIQSVFFTCPSQGSLKVLISIYPYLEKTPNFSRFYKKLGPFYKKLRCDKFGNWSISTRDLLPSKNDEFH